MSSRKEHVLTGAAVGSVTAALHPGLKHLPLGQRVLIGGLVAAVGACLPDLIEQPISPSHRSLAHSVSALGATLHGGWKAQSPIVTILALGYASHLFLDAGTPAGLPWLS